MTHVSAAASHTYNDLEILSGTNGAASGITIIATHSSLFVSFCNSIIIIVVVVYMGSFQSLQQKETPEQRRLRLAKERGVLMPPSFVNSQSTFPISSLALLQASQVIQPSLVDYLWRTDPGTRLLQDYSHAGISMRIPTNHHHGNILVHLQPPTATLSAVDSTPDSTNKKPTKKATSGHKRQEPVNDPSSSTPSSSASSTPTTTPSSSSVIVATHDWSPSFQMQFLMPTTHLNPPSIQLAYKAGDQFSLTARLAAKADERQLQPQPNPQEQPPLSNAADSTMTKSVSKNMLGDDHGSWIEAKYKTQLVLGKNGHDRQEGDTMDLVLSSWMTTSSLQQLGVDMMGSSSSSLSSWLSSLFSQKNSTTTTTPCIHLQAGIDYQQSVVAVQTEIPFVGGAKILDVPPKVTGLLMSINLNHPGTASVTPTSTTKLSEIEEADDTSLPAPLWLTLKHAPATYTSGTPLWILNLSQVLTFDRIVVNPLEGRAPHIRQTLGWVLQMEKQQQVDGDNSANTKWSAGATYQFNRSVAAKVILDENGHTLKYGAILKRWNQPRVTLSWMQQFNVLTGQHSRIGLGIELETAPLVDDSGGEEYPEHSSVPASQRQAPPTKIQLPRQQHFAKQN